MESKQLDSEIGQRGDLLDKIKAETRTVEKASLSMKPSTVVSGTASDEVYHNM